MIRLLIKDKQQHCFGWVYATDHSNIFVTTDHRNHFFNRPLDKREMSFTTYSNANDSYILGTLGPQIRGELARFLQNDCARTQKLDETHYGARAAEQSASLNGATTRLRGNWFTTAAGDAWYRYRCRGIKAFARADNACFDSLPITLSSEDLLDYARNRNVRSQWPMILDSSWSHIRIFCPPVGYGWIAKRHSRPCTEGPMAPGSGKHPALVSCHPQECWSRRSIRSRLMKKNFCMFPRAASTPLRTSGHGRSTCRLPRPTETSWSS